MQAYTIYYVDESGVIERNYWTNDNGYNLFLVTVVAGSYQMKQVDCSRHKNKQTVIKNLNRVINPCENARYFGTQRGAEKYFSGLKKQIKE